MVACGNKRHNYFSHDATAFTSQSLYSLTLSSMNKECDKEHFEPKTCKIKSSTHLSTSFVNIFPCSRTFSLMSVDYCVYARISRTSHGVVASACAFLSYTGTHQVENLQRWTIPTCMCSSIGKSVMVVISKLPVEIWLIHCFVLLLFVCVCVFLGFFF